MRTRVAVTLAFLLVVAPGCGRKKRKLPPAPAVHAGLTEVGIASWYGRPYHGRRAANGEIYDMEKMTAAHRTLPLDTWVRVENLANSKSVDVRITDRGPFVQGRIIDLSHAAARAIDMIGPGTAKVRLVVTAAAEARPSSEWYAVQVGAFQDRARAERLRGDMEKRHGFARLVLREASPPLWRVLVGREPSQEAAEGLARRIRAASSPAFVVRLDEPAS